MGDVYKAVDTRLDRAVAIKTLTIHSAVDPQAHQRFEREARAVGALSHPHICALYDVGSQDGVDFLVMEYLEGETLAARLSRGPIPLDQALACASQVASALDRAHRAGIVHRDLKPGNIMLTKSGAKLLDFGLARTAHGVGLGGERSESDLTAPGVILGTARYMAPEQLEGKEADARTDLFAFGSVLYEMLTGRKAFDAPSDAMLVATIMASQPRPLAEVQPQLPAALDYVIGRCLAKDPDDRWQTARDLRAEVDRIRAGPSVRPDPLAPPQRPIEVSSGAGARSASRLVIGAVAILALMRSWQTSPKEPTVALHPSAARRIRPLARSRRVAGRTSRRLQGAGPIASHVHLAEKLGARTQRRSRGPTAPITRARISGRPTADRWVSSRRESSNG